MTVMRAVRWLGRKLIAFATPIKRDRIVLVVESNSGSNTLAFFKRASPHFKATFELVLMREQGMSGLRAFVSKYRLLASAKMIMTTHASYRLQRKQLHFQLWHGALIKKNGVMLKSESPQRFKAPIDWARVNYILSYSDTYTTFMNACMVTDPFKYVVTGAPRNDLLLGSDGRENLVRIFGESIRHKKVVLLAPTLREGVDFLPGLIGGGNVFGLQPWHAREFELFLVKHNVALVMKTHPHHDDGSSGLTGGELRYFNLTEASLRAADLDLYELLGGIDLLVTDHSSLFYDFLLLDRPIVFVRNCGDAETPQRGFLVESVDDFLPGPCVSSQIDLQEAIFTAGSEADALYEQKRKAVRAMMHRFVDSGATRRLEDFIEPAMRA